MRIEQNSWIAKLTKKNYKNTQNQQPAIYTLILMSIIQCRYTELGFHPLIIITESTKHIHFIAHVQHTYKLQTWAPNYFVSEFKMKTNKRYMYEKFQTDITIKHGNKIPSISPHTVIIYTRALHCTRKNQNRAIMRWNVNTSPQLFCSLFEFVHTLRYRSKSIARSCVLNSI